MKRPFFMSLLLAFSLSSFAQRIHQFAGTYEFHFPGTSLSHYIVLKQSGDQLTGRYLGCEAGNDTLYYAASMKDLSIGADGTISFKLKGFRLSPVPLQPGKEEYASEGQQVIRDKIRDAAKPGKPLFLTGGYTFTGNISKKNIRLRRTADWYDNAADDMKFSKMK